MKLTGGAAIVVVIVQVLFVIWSLYLTYKIAQHVNAWPF